MAMSSLEISAPTRDAALKEALDRLRLPAEALDVAWSEEDDDLLAGARPFVRLTVSVRLDYVMEKACACARELLEKMELPAEVDAICEDDVVLIRIHTDAQDVLIGHHGETLDALQYLVLRMSNLNGREIPLVIVDVGDYRRRRIQRLERVARSLADSVLKTGKEEAFDPMDAIDRKIVHTLLKKVPGVKTYSRGVEDERHVIVAPAD